MRAATTPFLGLSVLIIAAWWLSRFSQALAPPREEHLAIRLILLWSFYPGALLWAALYHWCARRAALWGGGRAVRVFWLAALAPAPIPLVIHWALIAHDQAAGRGLYSHVGGGAMLIYLLPVLSVVLSTVVSVGLARAIGATRPGASEGT
ncbi:hypothetical protein KF840_25505 [bacterium]|nr:hypothetical protein [bacterium]